uniref:Uncharacterized protein n=1 Tax=Arundo donax TaxID=35708 RepID=A0A0A9CKR5_ARUDO
MPSSPAAMEALHSLHVAVPKPTKEYQKRTLALSSTLKCSKQFLDLCHHIRRTLSAFFWSALSLASVEKRRQLSRLRPTAGRSDGVLGAAGRKTRGSPVLFHPRTLPRIQRSCIYGD